MVAPVGISGQSEGRDPGSLSWINDRGVRYCLIHTVMDTLAYIAEETFIDKQQLSFVNVAGRISFFYVKSKIMFHLVCPYVIDSLKGVSCCSPKEENKWAWDLLMKIECLFLVGAIFGYRLRGVCKPACLSDDPHYVVESMERAAYIHGTFNCLAFFLEARVNSVFGKANKEQE